MFDHVTIRVGDSEASKRFYGLALGDPTDHGDGFTEWDEFGIAAATAEQPATARLHVGFGAADRAAVDRWWGRLTAAGYRSDGAPGERPEYHPGYHGAFVLDPDGHNVEAVFHDRS